MVLEGGEDGLLYKILNKQFEMIGEKMTYEKLPEDGMIIIDGKKIRYYDYYKWDSIEQYNQWVEWSYKELEHLGKSAADYIMHYADLRYGLIIRIIKKGKLF